MEGFKVPSTLPQDLLLIQEFVDVPESLVKVSKIQLKVEEEDIASSGNESESESGDSEEAMDSEDEVAANLTRGAASEEDEPVIKTRTPEPSDSSSESSDDDSDSGEHDTKERVLDIDDDEDPMQMPSNGYLTTKNEILEDDVAVPEVEQIGPDEVLEKVGEIMTIVDQVVIVRGLPSEYLTRASERALDSDTLLVFDDRQVMGYIYETFGPTLQPLYQVKFSSAFPLNPERVTVGREVFHVPTRSKFVFVSQIKAYKGSDASNVHDEEPADDELEFSDDEAEAAHKSRMKRKRSESRNRSAASSRASTPNPTLMRDQELADEAPFSGNAYDAHGPYDLDYNAPSSSRPTPIPYDDPYGDAYTAPDNTAEREPIAQEEQTVRPSSEPNRPQRGRGRGRGRGRDSGYQQNRGRGRGQGHNRGSGRDRGPPRRSEGPQMSPTSMAFGDSTPQQGGYPSYPHVPNTQEYSPLYPQQQSPSNFPHPSHQHPYPPQPFTQMPPFSAVQPHINPLFANAFGLAMYPNARAQEHGYVNPGTNFNPFGQAPQPSSDPSSWTNAWSGSSQQGYGGRRPGEDANNT